MKVLLQRVSEARVLVDGEVAGEIGRGLLLLVGAARGDTSEAARELAEKSARLRVFPSEDGRFDLSLLDVGGQALVVSQFTLLADTRRGRRPSFTDAAEPDLAATLIEEYARALESLGITVGRGRFGAHMMVELVNDGPVTIMLDG